MLQLPLGYEKVYMHMRKPAYWENQVRPEIQQHIDLMCSSNQVTVDQCLPAADSLPVLHGYIFSNGILHHNENENRQYVHNRCNSNCSF